MCYLLFLCKKEKIFALFEWNLFQSKFYMNCLYSILFYQKDCNSASIFIILLLNDPWLFPRPSRLGTSTVQVSRSACYNMSADNPQLLARFREISERKEEEEELNYKVKNSEMYGSLISCFVIYSYDGIMVTRLNFQQPLHQSSVSHDLSESIHSAMLISCSSNIFLLSSMLKIVLLLNIFVETVIHFFRDYLMNRSWKELHLFKIKIIGKIINVFSHFWSVFMSMLIKCINFLN